MIWDVHTHLNGVDGRTPDERMANLSGFADRMGIERVCVCHGLPVPTTRRRTSFASRTTRSSQALSHYHDRAFGFVYLNGKHPEASLREIDRCVKDGPMVGVKLWVARRAARRRSSTRSSPRATELKAPIFQHTWIKATGNLAGESTPLDLVALAKRHPKATLICGHSGGDWELGVRAIRDCPTSLVDRDRRLRPDGRVRRDGGAANSGAERVLYGSDAGGRSFASQLPKVQGADIPDDGEEADPRREPEAAAAPILRTRG